MRFYNRVSGIRSQSDREALIKEITDIYGAPPKETLNLINIGLFKGLGVKAGASHLSVNKRSAKVVFYGLSEGVAAALSKTAGAVLSAQTQPAVIFTGGGNMYGRVFTFLAAAQKAKV